MDSLVVSEKFYSIQGEGQTMGIPAVFLRLAGCNLLCKGDGWICDSIEVWRKGNKESFEEVLRGEYFQRLKDGAHLVITGGEPMLHQKKLKEFLIWFKSTYGWLPVIEIETNGTILPDEYFFEVVNYWNCSPKLGSSGETKTRRFNEVSLDRINRDDNSIFKFVIANENDVLEVLSDFGNLDFTKFVFMPAGDSKELLESTRVFVLEKCIQLGIKYSDRLHIVGWNQKTGV
jgi:organic radical activating enzyme